MFNTIRFTDYSFIHYREQIKVSSHKKGTFTENVLLQVLQRKKCFMNVFRMCMLIKWDFFKKRKKICRTHQVKPAVQLVWIYYCLPYLLLLLVLFIKMRFIIKFFITCFICKKFSHNMVTLFTRLLLYLAKMKQRTFQSRNLSVTCSEYKDVLKLDQKKI